MQLSNKINNSKNSSLADRPRLRVLFMANIPWDNAVSAYALELGLDFVERGHEVSFVVKPGSPLEKAAKHANFPNLLSLNLRSADPVKVAKNIFRLKNHIKDFSPEIINIFHSSDHVYALLTANKKNTTTIRTRGVHRKANLHPGNFFLYNKAAIAHIACADFIAEKHFPPLNISSERTHVIRPGIDVKKFREGAIEKTVARNLLGLEQNQAWIGHIARFTNIKAHRLVLDAFARLPKIVDSEPRLLCAGIEYDVKISSLQEHAAKLGILDRVTFIPGKRYDVRAILSAIDLLIVPSLSSEAISRIALEGLALGVPTIASRINSLPEIIGEVGILYKTGDIEEMKEAMYRGLNDPEFRKRAELEGPARISARYDRNRKTELTEELFYKCIQSNRSC